MEISLNWLRKYVDLSEDAETLSKALTSLGLEIEGMKILGGAATGVVAAEVLECGKHPEADKLSVCKVTDGTEVFPVVCGAPNVAKGQKVLLAKVGAELPGRAPGEPPFKIKKAKLRGQESHGMICAEDELGLGESHDGILVLPADTALGTPLQKIPGLTDVLFEVNVTPNRPDGLNHLGVARELAARLGKPLRYPSETLREEGAEASSQIDLRLEDLIGCTLYTGRVIRGVKVGPSPEWLVKALKSIGKKSINNVVDLTNYVLLELGQPSHAFDLDRIRGGRVEIRPGRAGEKLVTLDGVERKITGEDLIIADAQGPMVLAGVMGGKDSEVSAETKNIFLEVAYFNPSVVRKQSKRHGLSTDSSYRFERGVDPLSIGAVSDYLAALIARWCGGAVAKGRVERASPEHPNSPRVVYMRPARAEKLLGIKLGEAEAVQRLESIGLKKNGAGQVHGQEAIAFAVPGFRGDLEREADLIEEIARLGDINNIPARLPSLPLAPNPLPPQEALARVIRGFLRDAGLNETLSLRFSSRKALAKLDLPEGDARLKFVPLRNPLSEEWEILPTTALPSLLASVAHNQNNQERDCRFFEISKAFFDRSAERSDRLPGVKEEETVTLVLAGDWPDRRPWSADAAARSAPTEFAHLKGLVENLLARAGTPAEISYPSHQSYLHPVESAEVKAGGKTIGFFGALHPRAAARFDLKGAVLCAELSLEGLLGAPKRPAKFAAFGQHSAVTRDLNILVDEAMRHGDIVAKIPAGRIPNLQEARLNSVYRGAGVPEGKKALHYSFTYRHAEKTLTVEEVNAAQDKLRQELAKDQGIAFK